MENVEEACYLCYPQVVLAAALAQLKEESVKWQVYVPALIRDRLPPSPRSFHARAFLDESAAAIGPSAMSLPGQKEVVCGRR